MLKRLFVWIYNEPNIKQTTKSQVRHRFRCNGVYAIVYALRMRQAAKMYASLGRFEHYWQKKKNEEKNNQRLLKIKNCCNHRFNNNINDRTQFVF